MPGSVTITRITVEETMRPTDHGPLHCSLQSTCMMVSYSRTKTGEGKVVDTNFKDKTLTFVNVFILTATFWPWNNVPDFSTPCWRTLVVTSTKCLVSPTQTILYGSYSRAWDNCTAARRMRWTNYQQFADSSNVKRYTHPPSLSICRHLLPTLEPNYLPVTFDLYSHTSAETERTLSETSSPTSC